jgi:hypothetical protein
VGVLDVSTSPPKERYAVPKDNVIKLIQPGVFDDQLTDVKRAPGDARGLGRHAAPLVIVPWRSDRRRRRRVTIP